MDQNVVWGVLEHGGENNNGPKRGSGHAGRRIVRGVPAGA